MTMSAHRMAEVTGAHMAMSTPLARAWHRVAHGGLAPERAAALVDDAVERERALRIFTPPAPEQRQQQLEALLARLGHGASARQVSRKGS
jgi:hypothetical protein